MKLVDVTNDGRLKLVCDDDQGNSRYEPHDGSKLVLDEISLTLVRQHHMVACVKRDKADQQGIVLGPFRAANPDEWQRLA